MPRLIATHDVNDVALWLSSPRRAEVFAGIASDIRTFVDPQRPNRVGLTMDVADMDAFMAVLQSDAGAAAMEFDGVLPDTVELFIEG